MEKESSHGVKWYILEWGECPSIYRAKKVGGVSKSVGWAATWVVNRPSRRSADQAHGRQTIPQGRPTVRCTASLLQCLGCLLEVGFR